MIGAPPTTEPDFVRVGEDEKDCLRQASTSLVYSAPQGPCSDDHTVQTWFPVCIECIVWHLVAPCETDPHR